MNQRIVITMLLMFLGIGAYAQEAYTIHFDRSDYTISVGNNNILSIETSSLTDFYSEDNTAPAFPYRQVCILQPAGTSAASYTVELEKELLYEGVDLEAAPFVLSTNQQADSIVRIATTFPADPVFFGGNRIRGGYNYIFIGATPFVYDTDSRSIYFVTSLTVSFSLVEQEMSPSADKLLPIADEIAEMVINPQDMSRYYPQSQRNKVKKAASSVFVPVDYLIVTTNALAGEFERLKTFKIRKGLHAKIVTVEQINQEYNYGSTPLNIKHCLYDYYTSNGLKWVLLGGNATGVPSLMCTIKERNPQTNIEETITTPTDLFYACLEGDEDGFGWDANGNGIYGELTDKASLYPNIYVSRVPANNVSDVRNFVSKLITYETSWTNTKILFAAKDCEYTGNGKSHMQWQSEKVFSDYIRPYWQGDLAYLYDNSSNVDGYSHLTRNALIDAVNSGINIVDVFSHANYYGWTFTGDGNDLTGVFSNTNSQFLTNQAPCIVITPSCHINEFDNPAANCTGKNLLCDSHGAVAVLGSSRDGYFSSGNSITYSIAYDSKFYEKLFKGATSSTPCHFGAIAAEAKKEYINVAFKYFDIFRRLQFSINPLGDPEMPIYTKGSKWFGIPKITGEGSTVTVKTNGITGCDVVLTSANNGVTYFKKISNNNTDSCTFTNINFPFVVSISKNNYMTFVSDTLYTMIPSIQGDWFVCDSTVFNLNYSIPDNINFRWMFENFASNGFTIHTNPSRTSCTVYNNTYSFKEATICAVLSKGNYYTAQRKHKVASYGPFSATCSQASGSSNGYSYPARPEIAYDSLKGYRVNPGCTLTVVSPNFKYQPVYTEGAVPSSFRRTDIGGQQVEITLPYQAEEYEFYLKRENGDCDDFRVKFTVIPTSIHDTPPVTPSNNELDLWVNRSDGSLDIAMAYFDGDDRTSPLSYHDNWNLWLYKADSGTVIYNGAVSGLKHFSTSNWSGVYIIKAEVGAAIYVEKLMYK